MTRKDYVLIAQALKTAREQGEGLRASRVDSSWEEADNGREHGFDLSAMRTADALQADNKAFDRARFLKACGVAQ